MKIYAVFVLSVLTLPAYAQSILGSLEKYQKEIQPKQTSSENNPTPVAVDPVEKTKTTGQCLEKVQTSLPLAYITGLIMERDGKLNIKHDARSGKLSITSPDMISNCSSMIEFIPDVRVIDGKRTYSIEAKIKLGDECEGGLCTYDVAKVEKGEFKDFEKIKVAPSMQGFEQCLKDAGVLKDGKVDREAIYPSTVDEKFSGYKETGDLLFLSHGPASKLVKPKYDSNFVEIDECDHYEKISAEGIVLYSAQDQENARIMAEKESVSSCGDYEKIADFIEKYQGYADDLNAIRDSLILEAVKKASKNIAEGNYTEEDMKALADFEKYIVHPKIALAEFLYEEASALPNGSSEQKAIVEQMKGVMGQLNSYLKAPFLTPGHVAKLEGDGRFDDALMVRGMGELITKFGSVGLGDNQMSPSAARSEATITVARYKEELKGKKEKYDIRTGQSEGCFGMACSAYHARLASKHNQNVQVRTQNFTQEIYEEMARMQQPNGHCYRWFRNVQRCIQDSQERIQQLQAQMQHFNAQDVKFAAEAMEKAKEYAALEQEGRAYVARQNGEAPPVEDPNAINNMMPAPRTDGAYTFNFQGNPQMQPQQSMQNQQQPQHIYNQQPQQNMYGQQSYNPYAQFSQPQYGMGQQYYGQFNLGANLGGMGQQGQYNPYGQYSQSMYQQPQQNYWTNPYQAMGNFNMYGQQGYR